MQERYLKIVLLVLGLVITALISYIFFFQQRPAQKPVPEPESRALALAIETSINEARSDVLNTAFSHFGYLEKIADMMRFGNRGLVAKYSMQMEGQLGLGDHFAQDVLDHEGHFKFTRFYFDAQGRSHLIFRLYSREGFNFYDFELAWVRGEIKIIDAFLYADGSELTQMAFEAIRPQPKPRIYTDSEQRQESILELKKEIDRLLRAGQLKQAASRLEQMPPEFTSTFAFKALQLSVYSQLPEQLDQFEAIFKAIQHEHPEAEAYTAYWGLTFHSLKGSGPELREYVEKLKKLVGEDPLFNLFEGKAFLNEAKFIDATHHFDKVIDAYPFLSDPYWWKLEALVSGQNYQKAVEWIAFMVPLFELTEEDIEAIMAEYKDLGNSKSYYKWRGFKKI